MVTIHHRKRSDKDRDPKSQFVLKLLQLVLELRPFLSSSYSNFQKKESWSEFCFTSSEKIMKSNSNPHSWTAGLSAVLLSSSNPIVRRFSHILSLPTFLISSTLKKIGHSQPHFATQILIVWQSLSSCIWEEWCSSVKFQCPHYFTL